MPPRPRIGSKPFHGAVHNSGFHLAKSLLRVLYTPAQRIVAVKADFMTADPFKETP
jgi:hypothetical protein